MIKKINLISLMLFTWVNYAQVGININTPDASSALDIESTTGGILIPRMTEAQRDAIVLPALGLMIYQMDEISGFYFYDGNAWTKINGSNATITAGTGVTVSSGKVSIGQAVGVSDNVTFGEVSATTFDIGGADIASTAAELNILDGGTTASTVTLSGTDGIVINDDGVMKQALVSDISTYTNANISLTDTSITNAKLANSSISYGGVELSLGNIDDTPAFDLSDATQYPASSLSGTLPISIGGTGSTTAPMVGLITAANAAAARTALGVDASGTDNSNEVTLANTNYLSISGQEITGGTVPLSSGGTGATSAAAARTALGVAKGSDVQAYDAELAAVAGLTSAADKGIQFTGDGTAGTYDLTPAGKALLDDANASEQLVTLGLTANAAELNILDGGTTASTVTLSGTDGIVINDDGVMKQALVSDISTYTNNWTTSVFVNAGVDVTLGDLKVRMTNSDDLKRKSLEISTNNISNTYNVYGSAVYTKNGSISGKTIKNILPLNITHHYQFLHDAEEGNLGYGGDTATWLLMDTSKEIAWRITLIVGGGYSNNFISIERLH